MLSGSGSFHTLSQQAWDTLHIYIYIYTCTYAEVYAYIYTPTPTHTHNHHCRWGTPAEVAVVCGVLWGEHAHGRADDAVLKLGFRARHDVVARVELGLGAPEPSAGVDRDM